MAPTFTLIHPTIRPVGVDFLHANAVVHLATPDSEAALIADMNAHGSDAIITRGEPITRTMMLAVPSLKVVGLPGVGVDCIDVQAATETGVLVMNAPKVNFISVAEHTIGAMLAVAKNFATADQAVRGGDFQFRDRHYPMEINGKTLFVVGLGRIGSQVAKMCRDLLGMEVLGYDPIYNAEETSGRGAKKIPMDQGLAAADVVSVHVPLTAETRGFMNADAFSKMRPGAIFINTSRGPVVRQADLVDALQRGHLRGAGIDVLDPEPPAPDDAILKLPNVLLTPHFAGDTLEAKDRAAATICREMLNALLNLTYEGIVNPDVLTRRNFRLADTSRPIEA